MESLCSFLADTCSANTPWHCSFIGVKLECQVGLALQFHKGETLVSSRRNFSFMGKKLECHGAGTAESPSGAKEFSTSGLVKCAGEEIFQAQGRGLYFLKFILHDRMYGGG